MNFSTSTTLALNSPPGLHLASLVDKPHCIVRTVLLCSGSVRSCCHMFWKGSRNFSYALYIYSYLPGACPPPQTAHHHHRRVTKDQARQTLEGIFFWKEFIMTWSVKVYFDQNCGRGYTFSLKMTPRPGPRVDDSEWIKRSDDLCSNNLAGLAPKVIHPFPDNRRCAFSVFWEDLLWYRVFSRVFLEFLRSFHFYKFLYFFKNIFCHFSVVFWDF